MHWKGWAEEDRTWEPEGHLKNSPELVREFQKKTNPSAPRKMNIPLADFRSLFRPMDNATQPTPFVLEHEL